MSSLLTELNKGIQTSSAEETMAIGEQLAKELPADDLKSFDQSRNKFLSTLRRFRSRRKLQILSEKTTQVSHKD